MAGKEQAPHRTRRAVRTDEIVTPLELEMQLVVAMLGLGLDGEVAKRRGDAARAFVGGTAMFDHLIEGALAAKRRGAAFSVRPGEVTTLITPVEVLMQCARDLKSLEDLGSAVHVANLAAPYFREGFDDVVALLGGLS